MDVLLLLIFISFVFLAGGLLFFAQTVLAHEYDAADRTSLLPLQADLETKDRP